MNVAKKLTIPEELLTKTDVIVKKEGFLNFQDLVLTALRKYLQDEEHKNFLRSLQKNTHGKYLTKKDRLAMKEMSVEEQSKIFREFDLN